MTAATSPSQLRNAEVCARSFLWGWTAIGISQLALACSLIPYYVLGEPLRNPFGHRNNQIQPGVVVAKEDKPHLRIELQGPAILADAHEAAVATKEAVRGALHGASTAKDAASKLGQRVESVAVDSKRKLTAGVKSLWQRMSAAESEVLAPADAMKPENVGAISPPTEVAVAEAIPKERAVLPPAELKPIPLGVPRNWHNDLLTIAVIGALAAIPFALASWVYEDQRVLPLAAISCSVLALIWQFVVIGIVIGCAIYGLLFCLKFFPS